jgi:hypothetical protein
MQRYPDQKILWLAIAGNLSFLLLGYLRVVFEEEFVALVERTINRILLQMKLKEL